MLDLVLQAAEVDVEPQAAQSRSVVHAGAMEIQSEHDKLCIDTEQHHVVHRHTSKETETKKVSGKKKAGVCLNKTRESLRYTRNRKIALLQL
jgi:hypothetical protein